MEEKSIIADILAECRPPQKRSHVINKTYVAVILLFIFSAAVHYYQDQRIGQDDYRVITGLACTVSKAQGTFEADELDAAAAMVGRATPSDIRLGELNAALRYLQGRHAIVRRRTAGNER